MEGGDWRGGGRKKAQRAGLRLMSDLKGKSSFLWIVALGAIVIVYVYEMCDKLLAIVYQEGDLR